MATGAQVIDRLVPRLGLLPSTLDRQLRAQRLAGQLPTGRPGGGSRGAAHFEAQHLTNVFFGLAGAEPSDAPAAAEKLRSMRFHSAVPPVPSDRPQPLEMFEDQIAYGISAVAEACRAGGATYAATILRYEAVEISLCLDPRQAAIIFRLQGNPEQWFFYGFKDDSPISLRRVTVLHGRLMLDAGELLADTIRHIGLPKAVPFFAEPQPTEQKSAGNLRQEVAPAPFSDQPRANGTGRSSRSPEGIRQGIEVQAELVTPTKE